MAELMKMVYERRGDRLATYAERIKELRDAAHLTQEQLAKELHVERITVNRWEQSKNPPSEENVLALSQYFKVSSLYILGIIDDREMITGEDPEKVDERLRIADETRLLTIYRMLSPEMKRMIQAVVNNACLIDRDRGELKM